MLEIIGSQIIGKVLWDYFSGPKNSLWYKVLHEAQSEKPDHRFKANLKSNKSHFYEHTKSNNIAPFYPVNVELSYA